MTQDPLQDAPDQPDTKPGQAARFAAFESPFLHAPEGARGVFLVTFAAGCGPLAAGLLLFGWRAGLVAAVSIASCALIERLYYYVTKTPALLGRSHAYLVGLLLALTLPAYVPFYVPVVGAAFAIIVGKGVFGGVGHFIWQPALVGRLAVAVLFSTQLTTPAPNHPGSGPILAQGRLLVGDIRSAGYQDRFKTWRDSQASPGADALLVRRPEVTLKYVTNRRDPEFSGLTIRNPGTLDSGTLAMLKLPPINEMIYGARPGGIGETCIIVIVVSGLYLVYRNYVRLQLPLVFIAAAACVAAIAPVCLSGPHGTTVARWFPSVIKAEGSDAWLMYVAYQLLTGEIFLAAFLLAAETTSRPVTVGGQVIFAACGGALAMLGKLYIDTPIPAYMAVLAVNTMTVVIDDFWRPRVFGQKHFAMLMGWRKEKEP